MCRTFAAEPEVGLADEGFVFEAGLVADFEEGFFGLDAAVFAAVYTDGIKPPLEKFKFLGKVYWACRTFLASAFLLVVFFFASPVAVFFTGFLVVAEAGFFVGLAAAAGFFVITVLDFAVVAFAAMGFFDLTLEAYVRFFAVLSVADVASRRAGALFFFS